MTVSARDTSNLLKLIPALRMRDGGGVVRIIKQGKIRDAGNVQRLFYGGMTGVVSMPTQTRTNAGFGFPYTLYSLFPAEFTVTGALAPITYSWVRTSGDADMLIESPTAKATRFYSNFTAPDASRSAIFTVTATDAIGRTVTATAEQIFEVPY